jgi:hypothetical protein
VNNEEINVDVTNEMHISMIEGFLRHTFKNSKTRQLYCPPNVSLVVRMLIRNVEKYPYMKFLTFFYDKIKFVESSVCKIKAILNSLGVRLKKIALHRMLNNSLDDKLKAHLPHMTEIKKIQKYWRMALIKRKLWKEIKSSLPYLRMRLERNLRVRKDVSIIGDWKVVLSKLSNSDVRKINCEMKRIDKDKLFDIWAKFINREKDGLEHNFESRIYRTIINHAKWCPSILHQDLYWTTSGSSFLLLEYDKSQGLMIEIHGFLLRSFYRRVIANKYEPFVWDIPLSKRPIVAKGSLFNGIIRGIHSNKLDLLRQFSKDQIDGSELQKLFWIKYGKKSRNNKTIIKHVMWVRKGEDYVFVSSDHKYKIRNIDVTINDWISHLYDLSVIKVN